MGLSVFAENLGLFHKGSGGKGVAPGDVCLSPPPPPTGPMLTGDATPGEEESEIGEKRREFYEAPQATWELYRKLACEAEYLETFPGSFATVRRLECLWRLAYARRKQLELTYFTD